MDFKWMDKFIAQVPKDWNPEFDPLSPKDTLLGPVPQELMGAYRAGRYGEVLVNQLIERHDAEDHNSTNDGQELTLEIAKAMAARCKETHAHADVIRARAATLGVAALEGIRDHYNIPLTVEFAVKAEGVVSRPAVSEVDGIIDMLSDLMGEGSPLTGRVRVRHG